MDKEKRITYLNSLIERNKYNRNLEIWEVLAPMNEVYYLLWEKFNNILEKELNENKKDNAGGEVRMLRKDQA